MSKSIIDDWKNWKPEKDVEVFVNLCNQPTKLLAFVKAGQHFDISESNPVLDDEECTRIAIRNGSIGTLISLYERHLNETLKYAKELAELGVSHPWINRTDLTTERGPNTGMRSGPTKPRVDERLIGGLRMRLEVR